MTPWWNCCSSAFGKNRLRTGCRRWPRRVSRLVPCCRSTRRWPIRRCWRGRWLSTASILRRAPSRRLASGKAIRHARRLAPAGAAARRAHGRGARQRGEAQDSVRRQFWEGSARCPGSAAMPQREESMVMSRIARLAALAAVTAVTAGSPAVAQQPGITADSIKIGSFGALTGPVTSTASCP